VAESQKHNNMKHNIQNHIREKLYSSPTFMRLVLEHTAKTGTPLQYKGETIDKFTANMILVVAKKLNENNRKELFCRPLNEMVAIAYKVLTS
jgi:hypothetical protein